MLVAALADGQAGQVQVQGALNKKEDDEEGSCLMSVAAPVECRTPPSKSAVGDDGQPHAANEATEADEQIEVAHLDVTADLSSQFPNALIIHGLKHVADGALGRTLQAMTL